MTDGLSAIENLIRTSVHALHAGNGEVGLVVALRAVREVAPFVQGAVQLPQGVTQWTVLRVRCVAMYGWILAFYVVRELYCVVL